MNEHFGAKTSSAVVKSAKIMHLCSSVIFLIAGLLVVLVPEIENFQSFGMVVVGIASIIIGGTCLSLCQKFFGHRL